MAYIDLHIHSICSDGTMTPTEIVMEAKKKGLRGIAITDHDTVEGVAEESRAAREHDIDVLSGVEISAYLHDTPLHILGYGFQHDHPALLTGLAKVQKARHLRNVQILDNLNALGITIAPEDLERLSQRGQAGRPHIARLLVERNIVRNMDEAFEVYLRRDGRAYASRQVLAAREAIAMITAAGGIAVLAHPLTVDRTLASLPGIVTRLQEMGLAGIEIYYPIHSAKVRRRLKELSIQLDLLVTGGSDYHGAIRHGTSLGGNGTTPRVPYELMTKLKKHLARRNGIVS